jgi:uncharacterized membrane protein YfcA
MACREPRALGESDPAEQHHHRLSIDPALAVCAAAVFIGALIQGTGGIGFAMFAAPVVALVRPDLVPGPMIVTGAAVSLLAALRELSQVDWRGTAIAIGGRVPGSIAAGLVIGLAPRSTFAVAFALLILAAVALSVSGWRVRATPLAIAVAGFGSGLMGTITAVGAPPMGIALQNLPPARLRATVGAFLFVGGVVSLAVLAWAGRFGARDLALGVQLLLPMAAGFIVSSRLVRRIEPRAVRNVVLGVSAISAAILIVQHA